MPEIAIIGTKGLYSIQIDGIVAKLSRAQSTGENFERFKNLLAVATVFAGCIRERVRDRSQLAEGQFAQPFANSKAYKVSKEYSEKSGANGQMRFASSEAFHEKINSKVGSFKASGGLWDSMAVQGRGDQVSVSFQGDTEGTGQATQVPAKHGKFLVTVKVAQKIASGIKARQILNRQNINILTPTESEIEAMQSVYTIALQRKILASFGAKSETSTTRGDAILLSRLQNILL